MSFAKYLLDFIPKIGQLKFPAIQNPASDTHTLDDYRILPWTPNLNDGAGGFPTYALQVGSYIKIGRLVVASFEIILSSTNTLSGAIRIDGLPFVGGSQVNHWMSSIGFNAITSYVPAQQFSNIIMYMSSGGSTLLISGNKDNQGDNSNTARILQDFDLTNTSQLLGTIVYFTDN